MQHKLGDIGLTTVRLFGKKLSGICPFHDEKTGSFFIKDDQKTFHCFGCGAEGEVNKLVPNDEWLEASVTLLSYSDIEDNALFKEVMEIRKERGEQEPGSV